jgi:UDP-arabinose 4-epimerase
VGNWILVTGGAGYVGSHVCKALAKAGFRPVVYDNLCRGHAVAARWGPLAVADIADGATLRRIMHEYHVAAVVHLAAYAYVGESMQLPEMYFNNNLTGTLSLLHAMIDVGVRHIVFSSTCATFGLPHRLPIQEDHPQQPVNPYGESKLAVERALRWYGEARGLGWVALRYFNAAGADPDGELGEDHDPETHLVPLAIEAALGQRTCVHVYGTDYATPDGTAVRDYIHVTDLADAHVRR